MGTEKQLSSVVKRKASRKKKIFVAVLLLIGIIVLAGILLPVYLSSEAGKNFVIKKINESLDGQFSTDQFSVGWFKGIHLTNLTFSDNAGTASVNVKNLSTKVKYLSLLGGVLSLKDGLIDEPKIVVNLKEPVEVKTEAPKSADDTCKNTTGGGLLLARLDLEVNKGDFTINMPHADRQVKTVHFKNIESKVDINTLAGKSDFDVDFDVDDEKEQGKVIAKGQLQTGSKKGWMLKGGDFNIKISNLDLETLTPLFALAGQNIQASGKLNADLNVTLEDGKLQKLLANATLDNFGQTLGDKGISLDQPVKIDALITSGQDTFKIEKLKVESSFCQVACAGIADGVDYSAKADLEMLQKFAGQFTDFGGYTFAGKLNADGKLTYDKAGITSTGQGKVENFILTQAPDKSVIKTLLETNYNIKTDSAKGILQINSLQLAAKPDIGSVRLTDSVVPIDENAPDSITLNALIDADLEQAAPVVNVFYELPEGMKIAGKLKSECRVTKKQQLVRVLTDNTQIEKLYVGRQGEKPFEEDQAKVNLDAIFNLTEKTIVIDDLKVEGSQVSITKGNLTQSNNKGRKKIAGEFQAQYDLASIGQLAEVFIPQGLVMEGKRTSTIKFTSDYPADQPEGLMANLDAQADFGFDRAEYMGLNFGKTDTSIKVEKGVLTLAPFSSEVNGGKLNFAATSDFNQIPPLLKTPQPMQIIDKVNINDIISYQLLRYVNPIFSNTVNVSGVINFHCEKLSIPLAGANKNDLEVIGTIAMDSIQFQGRKNDLWGQIISYIGVGDTNFDIVPTRFLLQKGYLSYENMQVNVGNNPVNFAGSIGLNKQLDMTVELPYVIGSKTVRVGEKSSNRMKLLIGGTLDKPELKVEKMIEQQVEQLIESEAQKLLEKLLK